ncbi:Fasciclin-domain-containing protein [Ramaria rubella]|nr:Fasciclin-domain-containing protein [Ramaria rubella]
MFHPIVLALLAASPAFAQNSSSYLTGLVNALNGAGLNTLAGVAQNVSTTTTGQQLFGQLPNGNNTVFAPNNDAFNQTPPKNITDPNELAAILSYHVVSGSFSTSNFSNAPTHTILRTHLNNSQYVALEGNKSQALVLSNDNGNISVLNQNTPIHVLSSTTYQNLMIYVVSGVINPPPSLADVIDSSNLSMLSTAANQAGVLNSLESMHGITIFAPTNDAINAAIASLGGMDKVNASTLQTVLGNHIINGTSVYSTQLAEGNYISAAGEPLKYSTNSSGTYISSGSSSAKIITADVLTSNGVIHIIDSVLLNTQNDTAAASSACCTVYERDNRHRRNREHHIGTYNFSWC